VNQRIVRYNRGGMWSVGLGLIGWLGWKLEEEIGT
jgi:hypothetical protein